MIGSYVFMIVKLIIHFIYIFCKIEEILKHIQKSDIKKVAILFKKKKKLNTSFLNTEIKIRKTQQALFSYTIFYTLFKFNTKFFNPFFLTQKLNFLSCVEIVLNKMC